MTLELTNTSERSKISVLNLFSQILKNTQRPKPAFCLALSPFSPIFLYLKYSKNTQIKNPKFEIRTSAGTCFSGHIDKYSMLIETEFFLKNLVSSGELIGFKNS